MRRHSSCYISLLILAQVSNIFTEINMTLVNKERDYVISFPLWFVSLCVVCVNGRLYCVSVMFCLPTECVFVCFIGSVLND